MPFIQALQAQLFFKMRRSARAKRLQMLVREQQFEIVAPLKVKNSEVLAFVKQNQKWMLKQIKGKNAQAHSLNRFWPKDFLAGETFIFRAKEMMLNIKFGQKAMMNPDESSLTIRVPWGTVGEDLASYAKKQMLKWYQEAAWQILEKTIAHFCPQMGRWPSGYQLKLQKTRWGSCGITHKIHINWLLILAPEGVLEYVVLHELCHLFHRNHGKRFWAKVATYFPEYKKHEMWLRHNGHLLKPNE